MHDIWDILRKMPVFSVNDISKILQKSRDYSKQYAYRLAKKGLIKRIMKNKFTIFDDPFLISTFIHTPSYISYLSALRYHNILTQLPINIEVATLKSYKHITFNKTDIVFIKTNEFWGFKRYKYNEFMINIATPEKAVIDCLMKHYPVHLCYEAINSAELDKKIILDYLTRIKNQSTKKRMAYLLNKSGYEINELKLDYNYVFLDVNGPKKGKKNKKYRIIENVML